MIQEINSNNKSNVLQFFIEMWGSPEMVISTGSFNCSDLPGYIYYEDERILGLVTYVIRHNEIEIISLDSVSEGRGIGTTLVKAVESKAKQLGIIKVVLITTNDNLNALKFYQKIGFRITEVIPGAVDKARVIKSSIPVIGDNGIPLHDELKLLKIME